MGKLLKIVLTLLAVAVGLILVLAIVLPLIVDPNDYKDEIAAAVREKTGRTLTIDGDIGLSVFPWLGLDIGATRLSNAPGFEERPMASMEQVQVRVKLLPLLRKELEMDTVRLNGLQLYLGKDANGRTNWADLEGEPAAAAPAGEKGPAESGSGALAGLAIGGIEVTDAQVVWDDRAAANRYELDGLSLTTGAVEPGEPFDLELQFQVTASQPAMTGRIGLKGVIGIAPSLQAVDIRDAGLDLDLQGDTLPGGRLKLALASDVALDLEDQTLALPNLRLETLGLKVTGEVAGTAITGDDPRFTGKLAVAEFVPRDVIQALGQPSPDTADSSVLGKADAALQWQASTRAAAITALQLRLDDTTITGKAGITDFATQAITFALQADAIDLDRYLPPPAESGAPAAGTPAAAAAGGAGALPVDTLRSLNLDGTLRLGRLKAYNLRSTDIEVRVLAKDGLLRVHPAGAQLYDGRYTGDISLDARRDTPRISLNESITGVQAGPLLKDLTGDARLLGTGDLQARLTGAGATPEQIRETLNGTAGFSFTNGAVKGVNIAALIRNAQAKLQGQPAPTNDQPDQTDFAEMKGTATVTDGLVRNDDLSVKSPLLRISGKGQVSLPKETIDYLLTTKIVGSLEGQGGRALSELKGVAIPVRIGGTFSKPTYVPDLAAALGDAAQEKAKKKIEKKAKDLLKDKLGNGASDELLKGLFH
jgi:AsmA protein